MFTQAHCVVTGKVQMVGYRDYVQRTARHLSVTGTVANKEDGTVEIFAQGLPDNLKIFIQAIHEGSVLAHVESVAVDWSTPEQRFEDFVVIF